MNRSKLLGAAALALLLAGCAGFNFQSLSYTPPCAENLNYLRDRLVTPYDDLKEFIGEEALEKTLTEPIDEMIERGGGIDPTITAARNAVTEYEEILKQRDHIREDYLAVGRTEEWINIYLSSVQDGITINQAVVDASVCRQKRLEESASLPAPAT